MLLKALKCPVCGAELQVEPGAALCTCSYCDSTITIPKNLERRETLYNRAVFLRQSDEFDKAVAAYEELLQEDNEDDGPADPGGCGLQGGAGIRADGCARRV